MIHLGYELTPTERRVLDSPIGLRDKTNVTDVYAGIKYKIMDSISKLIVFAQYLDRMQLEDSKHVKEIKEVSFSPENIEPILQALMRADLPAHQKEEMARMMFALVIDHLLPKYEDDEIYDEMIMQPLNKLRENLGKVSRSKFYRDNTELKRVSKMLGEITKKGKRQKKA